MRFTMFEILYPADEEMMTKWGGRVMLVCSNGCLI